MESVAYYVPMQYSR